jgi:hypothetical protein
MTKQEKQKLAESLQSQLNRAEQMWKEGEFSHAYIIGWLQGTIKGVIEELGSQSK